MSKPLLTTVGNTAADLTNGCRLDGKKADVGLVRGFFCNMCPLVFAEVISHELSHYRDRAFSDWRSESGRCHLAFFIVGRRYDCSHNRFCVIDRYGKIDRRPVSRLSAHAPPYRSFVLWLSMIPLREIR